MIKISVVIPTYNRLEELELCLQAINRQSLPKDTWEVVIVNDGGESINTLVESHSVKFNLKYIDQENKGPAIARNVGVANAIGTIIAFTDDDCLPDFTWLERIVGVIEKNTLLGGEVLNYYTNNNYSEASQLLINFLYEYNKNTSDAFFTSNNFAIHKEDFLKVGGFSELFNTSAGEDREFCTRAAVEGVELNFEYSMQIMHAHFLNGKRFYSLHKKYGYAAYSYQKAVADKTTGITKKPKVKFYLALILYPFGENYSLKRKTILSSLLFLSQFYVALGYFKHRFNY